MPAQEQVQVPAEEAPAKTDLAGLDAAVVQCRACPRLVAWREQVARTKRAAYAHERYWGRPVPGFGPADARILIVGLAPAAHGGNRTGRMFTGDRSGDVLYAALHAEGLASQPHSVGVDDGMRLWHTRMTAPVHCAPPQNKPTTGERDTCRAWLQRELTLLAPTLRVVLALGSFGWTTVLGELGRAGWEVPRPRPKFGHGAAAWLPAGEAGEAGEGDGKGDANTGAGLWLLGSYHVSQQNTFTGKLTPEMLRSVLRQAREHAGLDR